MACSSNIFIYIYITHIAPRSSNIHTTYNQHNWWRRLYSIKYIFRRRMCTMIFPSQSRINEPKCNSIGVKNTRTRISNHVGNALKSVWSLGRLIDLSKNAKRCHPYKDDFIYLKKKHLWRLYLIGHTDHHHTTTHSHSNTLTRTSNIYLTK